MGEEKEILLRGKVCAYLTCRLMGDSHATPESELLSTLASESSYSLSPEAGQ